MLLRSYTMPKEKRGGFDCLWRIGPSLKVDLDLWDASNELELPFAYGVNDTPSPTTMILWSTCMVYESPSASPAAHGKGTVSEAYEKPS